MELSLPTMAGLVKSGRDSDAAKARRLSGGAFDVLNRQRLWRRSGRSRVLRHIVSAVTMRDGGGASWCEAVVQIATLPPQISARDEFR